MFQFGFPLFLAGALTFAVPVVIHLIFRLRKRRLVFPSLRFLQQSVLRESKRLRLREIILLLLRCLACILLALAFARPFRPDAALAGAGGKPQEDLVLVLDDSPSLLAQDGASIRWKGLTEKAREQLAKLAANDRVALVLASQPNEAKKELTVNFGSVLSALPEQPSHQRGDLNKALDTAIEMLAGSTQLTRRIVLFSDFQANQIDRGEWAKAAQKAAAAGRGIVVQLDSPSGEQPGRLKNLAIADVRPKSDVWIEGRPVPFAVKVSNHGETEQSKLTVKMIVDGKPAATRSIGLGPRSSTEFEMSALLPRAGEVSGHVEVESTDALPADDKRLFALRLRDSLRALVIEERLGERDAFLDEGYYVRMALDPRARGAESSGGSGSQVQVKSVEAAKLTAEMCRNTDLIVLVGISALKDSELALLEDAVREGRNMILFTGRGDGRLNEMFYNGPFFKNGRGLLPARPGTLYEGNLREGKYHQIDKFNAEHTLFKLFAGENEPHLRLARYLKHYQPNPADLKMGMEVGPASLPAGTEAGPTARPAGEVIATLGDGSPLVMERPYGKGQVMMFSFAPRPGATDLPERKAFVPLLHQAVRHYAGVATTSRRNLIVGEAFDFADAGAAPAADISLEKPGAAAAKEVVSAKGTEHPLADVPGLYTAAFQKGNVRERTLWAANLDARESDLNSEDLASLRDVFASNTLDVRAAAETGPRDWTEEQKQQAPDWRYFMFGALACLLLEVLLRDFF